MKNQRGIEGQGRKAGPLEGNRAERIQNWRVEWSLLQSCIGLEATPPSPSTGVQVSYRPQVALCLITASLSSRKIFTDFPGYMGCPRHMS